MSEVYIKLFGILHGITFDLGNFQNKIKLTDIDGKKCSFQLKRRRFDRYKYNSKGDIIRVKGGPALLYRKNKNLKNFNLAIVPPKKDN